MVKVSVERDGLPQSIIESNTKARKGSSEFGEERAVRGVGYMQEEIDALWEVEDLFARSLFTLAEAQIGIGIVFTRDAMSARPNGQSNFRLEIITDNDPWASYRDRAHTTTIGLGSLNDKKVKLPFDIHESYRSNRNFNPIINEKVIPFLIDFFNGSGFTVIQRDELFVPDNIFSQHQEEDPNLRSKVVSSEK